MSRATLKATLKRLVLGISNPLLARATLEHLCAIRMHELDTVLRLIERRGRLLEIGAGTGWQSRAMAHRGFDVSAIDLPTSNFVGQRIWNVQDYDGHTIPFPENTFDVVFSSNTLEHIPHVRAFQDEIRRVLKPDGVAIHVLPSVSWRFWTNLTHPLRYWTPPLAHGEHASNALSELFAFRRSTWLRLFSETGWHQHTHVKSCLLYTSPSPRD